MIDTSGLYQAVLRRTGRAPRFFHAPGRVNLIGEHTDYNDGFVLPVAIERGTLVAGVPREDRCVVVQSLNARETVEFDLDHPGPPRRGTWLDYVEGVAQALLQRGVPIGGADLALDSDVPLGSGLSSSAALEISVGLALCGLARVEIDRVALALAGQTAEHQYVGTRCGIMDQFIASLATPGHALLIDCRSLESQQIELNVPDTRIVICDSAVRHSLAGSEYNTRRAECARGVELLREVLPEIRALRDVSFVQFQEHADRLPDPIRSRCRHVITENERTVNAARAFAVGRLGEAGELMLASHASLRDDYEVSVPELDALVEAAMSVPGCAGARMTGGGFGGCTVNLVAADAVGAFESLVGEQYRRRTGRRATVFAVRPAGGAAEVPVTSTDSP